MTVSTGSRKQKSADLPWASKILSTAEKRGTSRIPFDDNYMAKRTKSYFQQTCRKSAERNNHREYLRLLKKVNIKQDKNVLIFTVENDPQLVGRGIIDDYFFAPDNLDKGLAITDTFSSTSSPEDLILSALSAVPGQQKSASDILQATGLKGRINAGDMRDALNTCLKLGYIRQSGNGKMGTTFYVPGVLDDKPF